ncbi:putative LRR receptor-like serine/threonine-protein kinase-like [Capsicum annuum]|nr:putative LRR receptor-like serine/threonine-protein kinase-like [Capsicum annuum]
MSGLIILVFEHNNLTGNILPEIGKLRRLQGLLIRNSKLRGHIAEAVCHLSNLVKLDMDRNELTGVIPECLGNLSMMQHLYLGCNKFSSKLPLSLWKMKCLLFINVSRNSIEGEIPENIGELKAIVDLDLSGNHLSGEIPADGVFANFTLQSFLGNKDLSGMHILEIPACPIDMSTMAATNLDATFDRINDDIEEMKCFLKEEAGCPDPHQGKEEIETSLVLDSELIESEALASSKSVLYIQYAKALWCDNIPPKDGNLFLEDDSTLMGKECVVSKMNTRSSTLGVHDDQFTLKCSSLLGHVNEVLKNSHVSDGVYRIYFDNGHNSLNILCGKTIAISFVHRDHVYENIFVCECRSDILGEGRAILGLGPWLILPFDPGTILGPLWPNIETRDSNLSVESLVLDSSLETLDAWEIEVPLVPLVTLSFLIFLLVSILIMKWLKKHKSKDVGKVPEMGTYQLISYHEIQRATNNFDGSNLIGEGSSGFVYKGTLSSGTVVAIKVLDLENEQVCKRFDTECEDMRNVRHRNLVPVITTCSSEYISAFVLQYMSNGRLENWLYGEDFHLNLLQSVTAMLDAAMAIEYLHHGNDTPIVHCDLKTTNILLDEDLVAHVCDFGISKILAISKSMEVLTKKRPTDEEICNENIDLRKWIIQLFSGTMMDVIEFNLFPEEEQITSKSEICIASMVELALDCTIEMPKSRIPMKDVFKRLNKIKNSFLET